MSLADLAATAAATATGGPVGGALMFIRRHWRWFAGAAAAIALAVLAHLAAEHFRDQGRAEVQADWDAAKARGALLVAKQNAALQAAKDAAEAAQAERDRAYELARRPIQNEVTAYVKTPAAAARCIDDRGVQIGNRAIAAANAALAAK